MIGHVLLDTNVASFILKHDTRAILFKPSIAGKLWALSFQTVAELEHWAALRGWGDRRKAELTKFLDQMVIFNSDRDLCKIWGRIRAQANEKGRPLDVAHLCHLCGSPNTDPYSFETAGRASLNSGRWLGLLQFGEEFGLKLLCKPPLKPLCL